MMTNHKLSESTRQALNYRSPLNTVPNPSPKSLFSIITGNQSNSIPGDSMDKVMVLVHYPNPDQDVVGLSKSTQKYLTILHYGLSRNNQSRF
jgi:hypothetical protein